jgi:tetratricopeptide (TPR) repeat protein
LKELRLDWTWPEFPAADSVRTAAVTKVDVVLGDPSKLAPTHEERSRQAIDHFRRGIEANPDDPFACNSLAWVYLTAPAGLRNVTAALPLAENAMRLDGGNAHYRNTLGVAYYRAGRHREAIETLRPNLDKQRDTSLPVDLYFLAMSYHQLGESARAQDYFAWANRWTAAQLDLAPSQLEELQRLRAEATELFKKESRESPKPELP